MIGARETAGVLFVVSVIAGSLIDAPHRTAPGGPTVLTGDFHVHAFPADGMLPVWEIQREAERRGLDVVAITNHNRNFAMPLARATGLLRDYPIVIASQEVTAPRYHMAAVGVSDMIDWRLTALDAINAIHAQGGVAIASHPVLVSWTDTDARALASLDGAEVAHPTILGVKRREFQLRQFYERTRTVNPGIAPIGSTDYHGGAPLGVCRTYVVVDEVSREGVLDSIRRGRTVASGPGGQLVGDKDLVRAVQEHLGASQPPNFGWAASTWLALLALSSLAVIVVRDGAQEKKWSSQGVV
ncbi:MAG: CehA/McbA family metallohydrolase [Vicinamibacterales bacterium]